jgi:hypothetical protein
VAWVCCANIVAAHLCVVQAPLWGQVGGGLCAVGPVGRRGLGCGCVMSVMLKHCIHWSHTDASCGPPCACMGVPGPHAQALLLLLLLLLPLC